MPRLPKLTFERGTLTLHPPPRGRGWIDYAVWDDRVEKFRVPAISYPFLIKCLQEEKVDFLDEAKIFHPLKLVSRLEMSPYVHQQEALSAWENGGNRGVVVLPTASGKTYLAQLAIEAIACSTLVVVPTLDLMHQWYAHLVAAFPEADIGLLGGGSRDKTSILVATYDSATLQAETLGNRYGLLVFDECHHLPTDFYRVIAEYAIAPYRLGLTATPDRSDGRHSDLNHLIGPTVYHRTPEQLAGVALAEHDIVQIKVKLSEPERDRYQELIKVRNDFLKNQNIRLGSLDGWKQFVMVSGRSASGRRAMLAHRQAKEIALCTDGKLRILADIISKNYPERTLIFTVDNTTVYRISQDFLIPAITHQTPVKERHQILDKFRQGEYRTLVASHVLNEGVDVPDAKIAIILSGTGSEREYIQRLGRVLRKGSQTGKRAVLYEVITENTSEEQTSQRRRGHKQPPPQKPKISPPTGLYDLERSLSPKAAESSEKWDIDN
ncbi:DEAD/DEAH box helicase family protein [Limnospira fusiformis KN01]|uniref:DNA 3'-5' helicase n=1 Tax=Limnospira fusiformis PMC 851.14 TaxID=2219512 RepID=A0ABU9EJM0_LIMFS|nr:MULTISPECIES: DEAD/DEAH box helicase family protein [Limnospira]MDY7054890.1 DEAD/DEAH box helicase family protein [Limnospira fusiformis LS22]QJB26746.1 DEAD/DEAH box helicase [Limnospira fusiformis SAG 85.79]MDT9189439.1 DEAD/DEAH box helicase family protein [Limnospira sp. PMC 894.15]MDT9199664.1 DEAD/DEAH box helicase family protein [Limnospira sp. PMC 1042.18]MDT9235293.1 DEAD/DEAH box helicase family protein [Limnospira sp. PMC 917.15]